MVGTGLPGAPRPLRSWDSAGGPGRRRQTSCYHWGTFCPGRTRRPYVHMETACAGVPLPLSSVERMVSGREGVGRRAGNGEKPSVPTQGSVALLPEPAGGRKLGQEAPQPSAPSVDPLFLTWDFLEDLPVHPALTSPTSPAGVRTSEPRGLWQQGAGQGFLR